MPNDDKIKDEKLQYDINREAVKVSASSTGKIDKYDDLAGEETLQALKPEENKEDIKSIEGIFPKDMKTNGI